MALFGENLYVVVNKNPALSEKLQKKLFKLGYTWRAGGKLVKFPDAIAIFIPTNKYLLVSVGQFVPPARYTRVTADCIFEQEEEEVPKGKNKDRYWIDENII